MLTARSETEQRIEGLEAGADDYLPKPFDPRELLLRVGNIVKRGARAHSRRSSRSFSAPSPSSSPGAN
jgi:DNA-binding response OmpR family regulator